MRYTILFLILFQLKGYLHAIQNISPRLNMVTVYFKGAELRYTADVSLQKGENEITLENLSSKMVPKSIQVTVNEAEIISIKEETDFSNQQEHNKQSNLLNDSISFINHQIITINDEIQALSSEKEFLISNRSIASENRGLNLSTIQNVSKFIREEHLNIQNKISSLNKKLRKLITQKTNLEATLKELNIDPNQQRKKIILKLHCNSSKEVNIKFRYLINDAGWAPYYDVIAEDVGKPLKIKYKAQAFNNSGIEWNDVKLTLSTADPFKPTTQPILSSWYLNYADAIYKGRKIAQVSNSYELEDSAPMSNMDGTYSFQDQLSLDVSGLLSWKQEVKNLDKTIDEVTSQLNENQDYKFDPSKSVSLRNLELLDTEIQKAAEENAKKRIQKENPRYNTIEVSALALDFDIKRAYSIPSNAKPYQIEINTIEIMPEYEYVAVPKIEKHAYLLANLSNWQEMQLIEGYANIYFNNSYVGQSLLQTNIIEDTLTLSLGPDKSFIVKRKALKGKTSRATFGKNKKESYSYEIAVKNNKPQTIHLKLYDQVPVSQSSDINVNIGNISSAQHNELNGQLLWKLEISPGETLRKTFDYSFSYPKYQAINRRQNLYQINYAPKF